MRLNVSAKVTIFIGNSNKPPAKNPALAIKKGCGNLWLSPLEAQMMTYKAKKPSPSGTWRTAIHIRISYISC